MVLYIQHKRKKREKGSGYMLNDEICKLREKLNESIISGQDYTVTYKLSIELDELIAKYYRKNEIRNKMKKEMIAKNCVLNK